VSSFIWSGPLLLGLLLSPPAEAADSNACLAYAIKRWVAERQVDMDFATATIEAGRNHYSSLIRHLFAFVDRARK
jgi:hypothetical protein